MALELGLSASGLARAKVYLVELASLADPGLVDAAVLESVGGGSSRSPPQAAVEYLREATALLVLLHQTAGILHAGRGRHHEALQEFSAAEHLASQMAGSRALASRVTGWLLAAQARLGMTGEARAALAALGDERASSGEIRNARAVICGRIHVVLIRQQVGY